jgi:hypothetical protein
VWRVFACTCIELTSIKFVTVRGAFRKRAKQRGGLGAGEERGKGRGRGGGGGRREGSDKRENRKSVDTALSNKTKTGLCRIK